MRLKIIGVFNQTHVGGSLLRASKKLGITADPINIQESFSRFRSLNFLSRLLISRPPHMLRFQKLVLKACIGKCDVLLSTGFAPISPSTLIELNKNGVSCLNYLTDDPWNPHMGSAWIRKALPHYQTIFSMRHSNIDDLKNIGCKDVRYLPFAYDDDLFFPQKKISDESSQSKDVLFAGGADDDRLPYITSFLRHGFSFSLWGGYWQNYPETRDLCNGIAPHQKLRQLIGKIKISLLLVRRANRDGHVMRTFELAATKACILAEKTPEHVEIFGEDRECVYYFESRKEMIQKTKELLANPSERKRLREAVYKKITQGKNTYQDRLKTMLKKFLPASS